MIRKTRLFTPGPTPLLPAAQFAMAAADMHHRTPEFRALYQKRAGAAQGLRRHEERRDAAGQLRHGRDGSFGLEPHLAGRPRAGADRRQIRRALDAICQGLRLRRRCGEARPTAQTFALDEVKAALKPETAPSTCRRPSPRPACGTMSKAIAKLLKDAKPDALLVVDAITGLGTTHFDVDGWGIDILIGGSQKAVMIPPGLAYLRVSERPGSAWRRPRTRATTSIFARSARTPRRASPRTRRRSR